jgi:putative ABC transport system permease protein
MKTWWTVEGEWLSDADTDAAMVGALLADRAGLAVGDLIAVRSADANKNLTVKGIFEAGSAEDERIYVPLSVAQAMTGRANVVSSVEVSALTTPDNELSRRAAQNPKSLSVKEWETWYCTAYVSAICYQIEEVLTDSVAKPIRQVAESEGAILEKTRLLMLLITILSLAGAALGISNLVTAGVMERSREIGLLKALGAGNAPVSWLILTEIFITGVIGGVVGYFVGLGFAQIIGQTVFDAAINIKPMVIPLVAVLVFLVTLAGSIPSIRLLLSLRPAEVLHGR